MNTYIVELQRTSYITVTVQARDQNEAEELAWNELANGYAGDKDDDASWNVESITEQE